MTVRHNLGPQSAAWAKEVEATLDQLKRDSVRLTACVDAVVDSASSTTSQTAGNTDTLTTVTDDTIPDIQGILDDLNTVQLPSLQSDLDNLNTVTIPGINSTLSGVATTLTTINGELTTLNGMFPITATNISNGAITTPKLAANSVDATKIVANTITAGQLAANTITAGQIAANTITGGQIAANSIGADRIVANSIGATQISSSYVYAGTVSANRITSGTMTGVIVQSSDGSGNTATLEDAGLWFGTGGSIGDAGSGGVGISGHLYAGNAQFTGGGATVTIDNLYTNYPPSFPGATMPGTGTARLTYSSSSTTSNPSDALFDTVNGHLVWNSSSQNYKDNIEALDIDPEKVFLVEPVTYTPIIMTDDPDNAEPEDLSPRPGFIAEQADSIIPGLASLDAEGNVNSMSYAMFTVYQQHALRYLKTENASLRADLTIALERITALENKTA